MTSSSSYSSVPIYTIDLSQDPSSRYNEVIGDFRLEILNLIPLFEEIVKETGLPLGITTWVARLFLRKLYDKEQTEEIQGISKVSGVDMYLLVCFNTLLDLLMGCTSGAARVRMNSRSPDTQMLHFRTLDWEMDPLRKVVVQLEFVRKPHGAVIARSITYAGFVGTLTGLKKGLSMSLNFRPYHNDSHSTLSNIRFNLHRLAVLIGLQPSIASSLRSLLLSNPAPYTLNDIETSLPSTPTTAAYLTFSDGRRAVVMEKDHLTATATSSTSFVSITNHDVTTRGNQDMDASDLSAIGMQDLVEDSRERLNFIEAKWRKLASSYRTPEEVERKAYATRRQLVNWVDDWPTTNETTHYAVVMNPLTGEFEYFKRYLEAVKEPCQ